MTKLPSLLRYPLQPNLPLPISSWLRCKSSKTMYPNNLCGLNISKFERLLDSNLQNLAGWFGIPYTELFLIVYLSRKGMK